MRLVRAVRQETQSWHLRRAAVEKMRKEVGLPPLPPDDANTGARAFELAGDTLAEEAEVLNRGAVQTREGRRRKGRIVMINADRVVRVVNINWAGGLSVKMRISAGGEVERGVANWSDGTRDVGIERAVVGRIEGVVERLGNESSRT